MNATLSAFFEWQRLRVARMPVPHLAPRPDPVVRAVPTGRCHDCGVCLRHRLSQRRHTCEGCQTARARAYRN